MTCGTKTCKTWRTKRRKTTSRTKRRIVSRTLVIVSCKTKMLWTTKATWLKGTMIKTRKKRNNLKTKRTGRKRRTKMMKR